MFRSLTLSLGFCALAAATAAEPIPSLPVRVARFAADPIRPRIYATVTSTNSVVVIDTRSRTIVKTIQVGSLPRGLCVSADGSKLWVANSGSTTAGIGVIDLATLTPLPSISTPGRPLDVEEGLSGRLYLNLFDDDFDAGIAQINSETGEFEGYAGGDPFLDGDYLETAADRKTLFLRSSGGYGLLKFDISATTAKFVQEARFSGGRDSGLSISHNGQFIVMPSAGGSGNGYSSYSIPTSDLEAIEGSFVTGAYPAAATWSNDDTLLYHSVTSQNLVKVFDTKTFVEVGSFWFGSDTGNYDGVNDIVVDRSGRWLFVARTSTIDRSDGSVAIFATDRSDPLQPRPAPSPIRHTARSLNISSRMTVSAGDNVLIGGFIVTGSVPKKLILRAIAPSLPVNGALSDPTLELHLNDGTVAANDDWKIDDVTGQSQEDAVRATELPPSDDRESLLIQTVSPGAYTAVVRGKNGATGVGLIEVYDADSETKARLANISTRGHVGVADNVLIGGFIAGPADTVASKVVVRALGPSLPVSGPLEDPTLELYDGNGTIIGKNDDYYQDPALQELDRLNLTPPYGSESALLRTLGPGAYTAIVRGKADTSGVGLIEVYNLQ